MVQIRDKQERKLYEVSTKVLCSEETISSHFYMSLWLPESLGTNGVLLTMTTGQLGKKFFPGSYTLLMNRSNSSVLPWLLKDAEKRPRAQSPSRNPVLPGISGDTSHP